MVARRVLAEVPMSYPRLSRIGIPAAVLVLCAALSGPAVAESVLQSIPSLDSLVSRLELTPEQEAQLRPLFEKRQSELQQSQALLQQATSKQQKREVLHDAKKSGDAFNKQVEKLLNPSQKHEWREIRGSIREKVKERAEEKRSSQ